MPRLWNVCRRHDYLTISDFVEGRYASHWLALAVALTGVLATMPYIALQLVGMQVVFEAMGFGAVRQGAEIALAVAFLVLALYTYTSGLRAPALIAFVKDSMIYIFVIAAIVVIPAHLGGYGAIFSRRREIVRGAGRRARHPAACRTGDAVRHARPGLGLRVVSVSARSHRHAGCVQRQHDPAQRDPASDLQRRARIDRIDGLHGHRRARAGEGHGGRAGTDPAKFSAVVRRILLRRDRAWRAGAGGDHVDRRGKSGHTQYLAPLCQSQHEPRRRNPPSPRSLRWR